MERVGHEVQRCALTAVTEFRTELYSCLVSRGDALFELCDALLCTDGPVRTLVDLALAPEHRRGHGALYSGLNRGRIDVAWLRRALAGVPLPRAADGRLVLAVDVSLWLRPDADTSSDRSFCHTFGRRPGQAPDGARLTVLNRRRAGDGDLVDRVARRDSAGARRGPGRRHRRPGPRGRRTPRRSRGGRPPKHGGEFVFGSPETWGEAAVVTVTDTERYGTATAQAWDRPHPRLTRRAVWGDHEGPFPIIEGRRRQFLFDIMACAVSWTTLPKRFKERFVLAGRLLSPGGWRSSAGAVGATVDVSGDLTSLVLRTDFGDDETRDAVRAALDAADEYCHARRMQATLIRDIVGIAAVPISHRRLQAVGSSQGGLP